MSTRAQTTFSASRRGFCSVPSNLIVDEDCTLFDDDVDEIDSVEGEQINLMN